MTRNGGEGAGAGWTLGVVLLWQGTERKKDFHEIRSPFLQLQTLTVDFKLCCIFSKHGYHVLDFVPKLGEIRSKARSLSSFLQKCQRKQFQDIGICHRTFFFFFFWLNSRRTVLITLCLSLYSSSHVRM